jgi:hypothetical protein
MAPWQPGQSWNNVGPRAVSSGVISGLAKQDSQGLGDAQRLLEMLDWQQLQARIGIDHDRHGHQLKALNAG